ncbi:hypothetical protein ETAA8_49760 [Anatilimnocola aggregata]|uniref:Uncharacterized protein n=1 Tax=Anatilimnocola aggregata TaxID=2528021 RepID=A0A517YHZ7_9BACT|nr:hypothetical protein [Anatilimnocola aggregata]QDU29860.1 hypothetical protein ETAA8_49760 [Anatilimnocola aggregata]
MNDPLATNRRTFPLSLLFVMLTGFAVMAAAAAPLFRDLDLEDSPEYLGAMVGGLVAGALLGIIIGLFQFHRGWGVLYGSAVGSGIGMIAGLMTRVSPDRVGALIQAVVIGSGILLITAWLIRPAIPPDEADIITAVEVLDERLRPQSAPPNDQRDTFA